MEGEGEIHEGKNVFIRCWEKVCKWFRRIINCKERICLI